MNIERTCFPMASTPATQAVAAFGSLNGKNEDPVTISYGGQQIEVTTVSDVTMFLGITAKRTWDYLILLATKYNNNAGDWTNDTVRFKLEDYMSYIGVENNRKTRSKYYEILRDDIKKLGMLHIRVGESMEIFGLLADLTLRKTDGKRATKADIVNGRGYFDVSLPSKLMAHFRECRYIMPFFTDLVQLVGQSENAYAIGKRLLWHFSMASNAGKENRCRLKVSTLLNCCPELRSERTDNIRARFEKNMALLSEVRPGKVSPLIDWNYCYQGELLTAKELKAKRVSYDDWCDLTIHFTILGYDSDWSCDESLDTAYGLQLTHEKENKTKQ